MYAAWSVDMTANSDLAAGSGVGLFHRLFEPVVKLSVDAEMPVVSIKAHEPLTDGLSGQFIPSFRDGGFTLPCRFLLGSVDFVDEIFKEREQMVANLLSGVRSLIHGVPPSGVMLSRHQQFAMERTPSSIQAPAVTLVVVDKCEIHTRSLPEGC